MEFAYFCVIMPVLFAFFCVIMPVLFALKTWRRRKLRRIFG
jgi:hypothetical protein